MIVLVDTDVLIDVALAREPFVGPAVRLLESLEQRPGAAYLAWHSLSNFHYMVAPTRGRSDAKGFLLELSRFIGVAPTTTESLRIAGGLEMADFEDALQVAAALACRAEVIATRNLKDYKRSPVPALSPEAVTEALEGAGF